MMERQSATEGGKGIGLWREGWKGAGKAEGGNRTGEGKEGRRVNMSGNGQMSLV